MYDLETIRRLNEEAHIRHIQRSQETGEIDLPKITRAPPPVFPLSILAKKLIGGPPSLAYFIELLESSETALAFLDLVRQYLPDHEIDIMAEDLTNRVPVFGRYFSQRYFPLRDEVYSGDVSIHYFIDAIPVEFMGFSELDYHYFADFRAGYILLLSLVSSPFAEGSFEDEIDDDQEDGGRVPIIEAVGGIAGEGLARLIPDEGWEPEALHNLTDGTKYEGCGHFADWVWANTGYIQLDTQGSAEYWGGINGESLEWDPDTVDLLTNEWPDVCEFQEEWFRVVRFLEEDPERNFRELIALLLDNNDLIVPKEQLLLPLDI